MKSRVDQQKPLQAYYYLNRRIYDLIDNRQIAMYRYLKKYRSSLKLERRK